jgi:hypothetical protein
LTTTSPESAPAATATATESETVPARVNVGRLDDSTNDSHRRCNQDRAFHDFVPFLF